MLLTNLTLDNNMAETIAKSPYIDYKWSSHTRANGDRELFDYGKSHSNGKLHFGRGIKFNGVDQSVTAYIPEFKTVIYTITAGSDATHYHIDCGTSCGIFWVVGSKPTVYYSGTNHNVNMLLEEDKTYTIAYVKTTSSVEAYINGSKVAEFEATTQVFGMHATTIGSESGMDDTVSNVIFINNVLTPQQIEYQYKYPEKFLYHEKTVNADGSATWEAKSKILTQDELNSVVAHLPMCETDGYARDMIGYSEDVNEVVNGTFNTDLNSWTLPTTRGTAEYSNGKVKITNDGDDGYPSINQALTLEANTSYLIQSDIYIGTSSKARIHMYDSDNSNLFNQEFTSDGKACFVYVTKNDITVSVNCYNYETGNTGTYVYFDNVSVKKLTSTYQIANFTNSIRDEAMNLSYGLQTCFWKRDVLGVPYAGSFDRLECDGVGYMSNDYMISDSNSWQIEMILYVNSENRNYGGIILYPFYLNTHTAVDVYLRLNDMSTGFSTGTGYQHLIIEYDAVSSVVKLYWNGGLELEGTVTKYGDYGLLKTLASTKYPIPLFKIHTTPQDPLELYNKAISTGKFGDVRSKAYIDAGTFDSKASNSYTFANDYNYIEDFTIWNTSTYSGSGSCTELDDGFTHMVTDGGDIRKSYYINSNPSEMASDDLYLITVEVRNHKNGSFKIIFDGDGLPTTQAYNTNGVFTETIQLSAIEVDRIQTLRYNTNPVDLEYRIHSIKRVKNLPGERTIIERGTNV